MGGILGIVVNLHLPFCHFSTFSPFFRPLLVIWTHFLLVVTRSLQILSFSSINLSASDDNCRFGHWKGDFIGPIVPCIILTLLKNVPQCTNKVGEKGRVGSLILSHKRIVYYPWYAGSNLMQKNGGFFPFPPFWSLRPKIP